MFKQKLLDTARDTIRRKPQRSFFPLISETNGIRENEQVKGFQEEGDGNGGLVTLADRKAERYSKTDLILQNRPP
jgi:hypothetical protein